MQSELSFTNDIRRPDNASIIETTIRGEITGILFQSQDSQFSVIKVATHDNEEYVLVGTLDGIREGQEIEAKGCWENHKKFGRRFKVNYFKEILPTTEAGIKYYLSSGIIPGIGPKLAERIVDKFGVDTLKILDNFSSRLSEVSGIGKNRVHQIREIWRTKTERRESFIFLHGLGVSNAYCNRIFKKYGEKAVAIVRKNPYRIANEVKGIGFKMADQIAGKLNIAKDNPFRLGSGIVYVLHQLTDRQGHTCYPSKELIEKTAEILDVSTALAADGLKRTLDDGAVIACNQGRIPGNELIYPRDLYIAESKLADDIRLRAKLTINNEALIGRQHSGQWEFLNPDQRLAVLSAFRYPISIITGGPGVGKTTVTREIVAIALAINMNVALAAPTGRAAKRLSESSHYQASTIHRLLKWDPEKQVFVHNEKNPLKIELIIIDEVSMLDVVLAERLLNALTPDTTIVLVGDRHQLPSIGPGSFLSDLIHCGKINVTHLSQIFRQSKGSHIISNAHRVNSGSLPELSQSKDTVTDFYWINQEDQGRIVDIICRMVAERIPEKFKLSSLKDVQVLTPMNQGLCGGKNLNRCLQNVINPPVTDSTPQFQTGDTAFRHGDRVMQLVNNYDLNVFNGDLGLIQSIDTTNHCLHVSFDTATVVYDFDDANQLRLAYAITIHKSQGSEFPAVIVPVIPQHYVMLQRNLIYTAMTRAKKLLIMIGSKKALAMAVNNHKLTPRFTRLEYRINLPTF